MQATERIHLRTTPHAKAIIEQASQMMGVSVSNFMVEQAYQKAVELLHSRQIILTNDEWANAIKLLENPPKANAKMQALCENGYRVIHQQTE